MSGPFPIFITKFCLASGEIEEATAWHYPGKPEWCVAATGRFEGMTLFDSWYRTRAEAVKEANRAKAAAIKSASEKLARYEALNFEAKDERTTSDAA